VLVRDLDRFGGWLSRSGVAARRERERLVGGGVRVEGVREFSDRRGDPRVR
jgi:hypothetical protein